MKYLNVKKINNFFKTITIKTDTLDNYIKKEKNFTN